MWVLCSLVVIVGCFSFGEGYSKYGRSCKDIGCLSNEMCVMESDPCSYYSRENECGSYPTCKKTSSNSDRTCATYVCPPSQVCKMDGHTPKCYNDASASGHVGYNTHTANAPLSGDQKPSAPQPDGGSLYPSIPRGETTPRPNIHRPASGAGGGYQGGQVGSGYPGQGGSYQQPGGRYPQQPGYPNQGYPNQGYPNQGYPNQGQGYPNQGYPQGGYQQQYPGYNGQNPYYQNPYPNKNSGNSFTDKLSSSLKSIGTDFLKSYIQKAITGGNRN